LALFLLISPAFATQYLAWPLAAAYLIDLWAATLYNLSAGVLLAEVYNRWNGGLPWDDARAGPLLPKEVAALAAVWVVLLLVVIAGLRHITKPAQTEGLLPVGQPARAGSSPRTAEESPTALFRRGSAAVAGNSPAVIRTAGP
jgi:hypothetical protein